MVLCYRELFSLYFLFCSLLSHSSVANGEHLANHYELDPYNLGDFKISAKEIALLVEDSQQNLRNILRLLDGLLSDNRSIDYDFWLITFNSSGVLSIWDKSFRSVDAFYTRVKSFAFQSSIKSDLSPNDTLPLYALLHTAQILPEYGAIIFLTNSLKIVDSRLKSFTKNTILSKNIRVYTLTSDNKHGKQYLLQHFRERSSGKILNFKATMPFRYDHYRQHPYTDVSIVLSKRNLMYVNKLSFPIEHGVTGIHISITPSSTTVGTLISPSGYKFLFSNKVNSNKNQYSLGSEFKIQNGYFELHLNFSSTSDRPTVGIWLIKLENLRTAYNVSVFSFTNITAVTRNKHFTGAEAINNGTLEDVTKLGATGYVSHITNISVLDINSDTMLGNKSFKFNNNHLKYVTENTDNVQDIDKNALQQIKPFNAMARRTGNAFQSLRYIFGKNDIYPQQSITVEIGLGSEVIVSFGRKAEIYFEVTNHGNTAQLVSFTCSDAKYILHSLSLYRRHLEPQESTLATLYLDTKLRISTYQDEITFSVTSGPQLIQKKVLVDVGSQIIDNTQPELHHKYTSDCTGIIFTQCSKGTWTIEITARDIESGLLQLNTIPKGIFFPHGYTSGTKDSVTGYYSESCCNPHLQISAVDRMNNRKSYDVNAYHARWSPGAIAALVLGILLFIIVIAAAGFFIYRKSRPKESFDLPTYRGGGI